MCIKYFTRILLMIRMNQSIYLAAISNFNALKLANICFHFQGRPILMFMISRIEILNDIFTSNYDRYSIDINIF